MALVPLKSITFPDLPDTYTVPTVDATLTTSGEAADAKTTGDEINDLKVGLFGLYNEKTFDFSSVTQSQLCINDLGKWTSGSTQRSYAIELDDKVKAISVTANSTGGIVAFLSTYNPVSGDYADFSNKYPVRIELSANEKRDFIIEGNMNYFYALLKTNSQGIDKTPTVKLCYAKSDELCSEIEYDYNIINEFSNWAITISTTTGGWWKQQSGSARSKVFKIPRNTQKIKVTANSSYDSCIACLKSCVPVQNAEPDFSEGWERTLISPNNTMEFDVNSDCNYFYCTTINSSGYDITPTVKLITVDSFDNVLYATDIESVSETGKHDRTNDIISVLNTEGVCRLSKGVFYVSGNIKMPTGSSIIGSGAGTVIKLLSSASSASTVLMDASCTVKDLTLKGSDSSEASTSNGTRYGIEWTGSELLEGFISNCQILNYSGSGIYLHDTTTKTYRNLSIVGCYINGNAIGIDIRKNSEFNKIVNCTIVGNGIGYRNRGGNNDIANSGIDANTIGIEIDEDEGSNGGHGTITGCSVNHSDHNSGYGLIIKDTGRMLVSNCNFYYSKIKLDTTDGNVISGCGFGTSAAWEITGGSCSLFIGCMVRGWDSDNSPVTITNNSDVKIINCYDRTGTLYT